MGAWVCEIQYRRVSVGLCEGAHSSVKSPIVRGENILAHISPQEVLYKETQDPAQWLQETGKYLRDSSTIYITHSSETCMFKNSLESFSHLKNFFLLCGNLGYGVTRTVFHPREDFFALCCPDTIKPVTGCAKGSDVNIALVQKKV